MSIIQYRTLDNLSLVTSETIDLTGGSDGDVLIYNAGTAVPGGTSAGTIGSLAVTGAVTAGTYDFTASNIGGGTGLVSGITGKDIQLRTIVGTNTVTAQVVGDTITLDAGGEYIETSIPALDFPENLADDWVWISPGSGTTETNGVFSVFLGDSSVSDVQTTPNSSVLAASDNNTGQNLLILRCPLWIPPAAANVITAQWAAEDGASLPRTPITFGMRILSGTNPRDSDVRTFVRWQSFFPTRVGAVADGGYATFLSIDSRIGLGWGNTIWSSTENCMIQVYHDITVARFPALPAATPIRFMNFPPVFLNNAATVTGSSHTTGLFIVKKWRNM